MRVVVRSEKSLPIYALSSSVVDLSLGEAAEWEEIHGDTIPASWQNAASMVGKPEHRRIVVIGRIDVGKTSFCTYLVNKLLEWKQRPVVLDADIGQHDIGPPATISAGTPDRPVFDLTLLNPVVATFVGDTSPAHVQNKVLEGILRILNHPKIKERLVIVNTDGWIQDPEAVAYKARLIQAISPDFLITLGGESELEEITNQAGSRRLAAEGSRYVRIRDREDRRTLREAAFRRWLIDGRHFSLSISNVSMRGEINTNEAKNSLVGLLDSDGFLLGICTCHAIDRARGLIRLFGKPVTHAAAVEFGRIKVNERGEEIEHG